LPAIHQPRFISLNTPSGSAHLVSAADYPIESEKQIAAAQVHEDICYLDRGWRHINFSQR
jgi:hypothetical protein